MSHSFVIRTLVYLQGKYPMDLSSNFNKWFGIVPLKKDNSTLELTEPTDRKVSSTAEKEARRTRQDSNLLAFYKAMDLAG